MFPLKLHENEKNENNYSVWKVILTTKTPLQAQENICFLSRKGGSFVI